jgi:hypothetical protein
MAFIGTTFSIFQGLWRLVCHVIDMIQSKPLILLASAIPSPACGGASAAPSLPPSGPRGWRRAALAPIKNVGTSIGQIENTQGIPWFGICQICL